MTKNSYATPEDAEKAFYAAIKNADLTAMMSVWSEDDAAVCIHPGAPRLEGRKQIQQSWQEIFEAGPPMEFTVTDERITREGHLAVHLVREMIEIEGELVTVMLSTNIYHLLGDGWRMMLHHASPEPELLMDELETEWQEPVVLH